MPTGFGFLAISYALFAATLLVESSSVTHNTMAWMSLIASSYGFSMMALSYFYSHAEFNEGSKLVRIMAYSALPLIIMIGAIEFATSEQMLISFKLIDEYFAAYNLIALGYIIVKCTTGVLRGDGAKLFYFPAGFALLWIAQYTILAWVIYENSIAVVLSLLASLLGPVLFIYALHKSVLRSGKIAKATKA